MSTIEVKNIYYDYEGKGEYAVNNASFSITGGSIFGLLGPKGAGRSTIHNIMAGLLLPHKGEVLYHNRPINKVQSDFLNHIGISFEQPYLYSKLSGIENLKYYAGLFDVSTQDPMKLLDMVGLRESANKRTITYSNEMKRCLALARALINNPEIMLLDEPFSGLGLSAANRIKEIIINKKGKGDSIFLTTSDAHIAEELCSQVAFLNQGQIITLDLPQNLKSKYGEKSVQVKRKQNDNITTEAFFLENDKDREALNRIINNRDFLAIHSQETTLEQIFARLTGRNISS